MYICMYVCMYSLVTYCNFISVHTRVHLRHFTPHLTEEVCRLMRILGVAVVACCWCVAGVLLACCWCVAGVCGWCVLLVC